MYKLFRRFLSLIIQHPILFTVIFLCLAALIAYGVFRLVRRKHLFVRALSRDLNRAPGVSVIGDRSGTLLGHLDDYVPHVLRDTDDDSAEGVAFDTMVHDLKRALPGLCVISGQEGVGKTDLMLDLAYAMRRKPFLPPTKDLTSYGEVFMDLSQFTDVQAVLDELSRRTARLAAGKKPVTVLLDSFDAFCTACGEEAEVLFGRLLTQLCRSGLYDRCLHLIIATRPDVFRAGVPDRDDMPVRVYSVKPLTVRQARELYTKISTRIREDAAARKTHIKQLEGLYQADTLFRKPFVIKWAPELLTGRKRDSIEDLDYFDVLDVIMTRGIRRALRQPGTSKKDAAEREAAFRDKARKAALAAVGTTLTRRVPADVVRGLTVGTEKGTSDALALTITGGTGSSHGAAGWFPDGTILQYLLADAAADPATDADVRAGIHAAAGRELQALCLEAVYNRHRSSLDYPAPEQFCADAGTRHHLRFRRGGTPAEAVYPLVPGIKTVSLNHTPFDEDQTKDLMQNGVLDLYGRGSRLLRAAPCLSEPHVRTLDISGLGADDTDTLMKVVRHMPALEELDIADCSLELERLFRDCPRAGQIRLLCTAREDTALPTDPDAYRFRQIAFILPRSGFPAVYDTVYELKKAGAPVAVASSYECGPDDTCADTARLESVFEMERHRLLAEEARTGGLLPTEQYLSAFNLCCLLSGRPDAGDVLADAADFLRERLLVWDTRTIRCPIRFPEDNGLAGRVASLVTTLARRTTDPYIRMAEVCRRDVQTKGDRSGFLPQYRDLAYDGNRFARIWLGIADQHGYYGLPIDPGKALTRFREAAAVGPAHDRYTAEAEHLAGELLTAAGRLEEAEACFRRAWETRLSVLGAQNVETARSADALGSVLDRMDQPKEAAERLSEAYAARCQNPGRDHADTVNTACRLGGVLDRLGRFREGADILSGAAAIRAEKLGEEHLGTAAARCELGNALFGLKQYAEAAECFRKAYTVRDAKLGAAHPDTLEALTCYARSLDESGRDGDAVPLYRTAQSAYEASTLSETTAAAELDSRLGAALYRLGRGDEAETELKKAVDIRGRLPDPDAADPVRTAGLLGQILYEDDRFEEALPFLKKAVAEDGGDPTKSAYDRCRLGVSLYKTGSISEAAECMGQAVAAMTQAVGSSHEDTVDACHIHGRILQSLGRYEEAAGCFNRVRAYDEKQFGSDHPDVASTYLELGVALAGAGRTGEAKTYLGKAERIRQTLSGPDHPDTAEVRYQLGRLAYSAGQYKEAAAALTQAHTVFENQPGKPQLRTADTEIWLARALRRLERHSEAWVMLEKARRIRESTLGLIHADTAEVYRELGDVLIKLGRGKEAAYCRDKEAYIRSKLS
ncbi:MAG: tetratricopeptide repeat protein [Clostridia bacterium]|nr:tetratricopeptide repeat protein [Clostridia bacterium]